MVGPTLAIINQTSAVLALLGGDGLPLETAGRIALTFLVPFAVSLYTQPQTPATTPAEDDR